MLQSAAPGSVRDRAINDRAGERSWTEAVFRNLPSRGEQRPGRQAGARCRLQRE